MRYMCAVMDLCDKMVLTVTKRKRPLMDKRSTVSIHGIRLCKMNKIKLGISDNAYVYLAFLASLTGFLGAAILRS